MISFKEFFLINIRPNKVRVENLKTHEYQEKELSFGNERLLIIDTNEPESTLKQMVTELAPISFIKLSRTIILNPYHPNIGDFTEVEKMLFRDMAVQLGANHVYFKFGENVTSAQVDIKFLHSQTQV